MNGNLLIIEDDKLMSHSLNVFFSRKGYQVSVAVTSREGLSLCRENKYDLAVVDLKLPDMDGLEVLQQMRQLDDDPTILITTAYPEVETAILAMKAGAFDYLTKPFELDELDIVVGKALESRRLRSEVLRLRHQTQRMNRAPEILGSSACIREVKDLIGRVARAPHTPVLIQGESGTGKELVADAIHYASDRAERPLVKINCSAIPESLLESELFGFEKGAFTGAQQGRQGLLELADGGSLFLDEIGDFSPALQPKLLRVIEGQPFWKLGGRRDVRVDVRIIAATHRDLSTLVQQGAFRDDLYYRLHVIVVDVPPLRDRGEDILLLARRFLREIGQEMGKEVREFSDPARKLLLNYAWPGNVRELKNVLERAVILTHSDMLQPKDLPRELRENFVSESSESLSPPLDGDLSLKTLERLHIHRTLDHFDGNKSQTAKALGIARSTLEQKIK